MRTFQWMMAAVLVLFPVGCGGNGGKAGEDVADARQADGTEVAEDVRPPPPDGSVVDVGPDVGLVDAVPEILAEVLEDVVSVPDLVEDLPAPPDGVEELPPVEDVPPTEEVAEVAEELHEDTGSVGECQPEKINFDQSNVPMYEFYELCATGDKAAAEAAVKAIDPTLYCGMAGVFAKCSGNETACHGDLDFIVPTKEISDEKWATLCHLSSLPFVTKIGGGHWL
jgi:hypothetical protein